MIVPAPVPAPARRPATLGVAALVTTASALALATALRLPAAWSSGDALNHVSGAWLALAEDLAHGTFYRPLVDPALGTGGTRFFPLLFSLHAALRTAGADLLAAGYLLSLASGLSVLAGVYALARGCGRGPPIAAALAVLAFAALAPQEALTSARGDLLPVGLSALGLALLAGIPDRVRTRLVLAVLAFGLAFAAKPTALTAPAAGAAWLLLRGDRRAAVALATGVAALAAAVVGAADALSDGRFLALLAACAAGGAGPADLLRGPARLVGELVHEDRAGIVLLCAGLAAALAAAPGHLRAARTGPLAPAALPALWLLAALAGAVVVFSSPGTTSNHLIEAEAASAAAFAGAWEAGRRARWVARALAPLAAVAGLAAALHLGAVDHRDSTRLRDLRAVSAWLPPGSILSEDPLLPLLRGERPYLLDPFMLRLAAARDAGVAQPLEQRLRSRSFAAVVLYWDLDDPEFARWYSKVHLGEGVAAAIRGAYEPVRRIGRYVLYLPRAQGTPQPAWPRPVVANDRPSTPARGTLRVRGPTLRMSGE
ncbi:MAG: hypothetical protein QM704_07205 [Anaeromyxobacteraceae bacterium]